MKLPLLIMALFLGCVLAFSAATCQAQTVDERPPAVVAQQEPTPPARRPAQQSPSDLPIPEPGQVEEAKEEAKPHCQPCQPACSPCRPLRRCCRSLLGIFRRCR